MAFGTAARQAIALLVFNGTTWAGWADNTVTSPITTISVSLHTADPTTGNQTTSESAYTSYARVSPARTSGGYSCTSGVATNVAAVTFPACTGGSSSLTHCALGKASSGTGEVMTAGALTAGLSVTNGITPQFAISGLSCTIA